MRRFSAGVGRVMRLTTTKTTALSATPTSTESMPCEAKLRCNVNVQIRQPRNPATMLQMAPSRVPRRQFKPEHDRHEEETGDELRLFDDDRLNVANLAGGKPERHDAEHHDRDAVHPNHLPLRRMAG